MNKLIHLVAVLSAIWLLPFYSLAQSVSIHGKVTDPIGKPIAGATIKIKGINKVTSTTDDGTYSIQLTTSANQLEISYVGFTTQTININGQTNINIVLQESRSQLSDVVVIGYGTQKKSDITGAISSIKNKDFKDQPVSNIAQSIQGKVAGILVTTPSGTPGAGLLVSVRGASNPLYVVDGVPMISESNSALSTSYNTDGTEMGSGQNISSISDINPDDIESIEILKDASSASIYGARAANGVVLVTTKRGKNGKTEFSFNSYAGLQNVAHKIPFLDESAHLLLFSIIDINFRLYISIKLSLSASFI